MKKVLFLMFLLLLMGLGAAGVKAQVRIGGSGAPNAAAVLDLNADDSATPAGNKGALALPRVSLASTTAQLNGNTPITGMMVYNTNTTLGVGIYFWNGTNWIIISGDGVIGNELTDTIAGGGLTKIGNGTTANPWKVGLKTGGVRMSHTSLTIYTVSVTVPPNAGGAVDAPVPGTCTINNTWYTASGGPYITSYWNSDGTGITIVRTISYGASTPCLVRFFCFL